MYSDDPLIQQLVSLLKQFHVKHFVVSPGSRHFPLVASLQADPFFKLYSVVDERSAAFYALGLIQQTNEVAAVCCSSGTACINYGSAVVEAFYQKLPLLVLSSDRLPELLNQNEDQMYDQLSSFKTFVKYSGQLKVINSSLDAWYSNRIINEGLLALTHHGRGPVHLNLPIASHSAGKNNVAVLPVARKISRHAYLAESDWEQHSQALNGKKVVIVWGQSVPMNDSLLSAVEAFVDTYDAIILTDHLSHVHHPKAIKNLPLVFSLLTPKSRQALMPDVVISVGGNYIFNGEMKLFLKEGTAEHWQVGEDGTVCDPFRTLSHIFEIPEVLFFRAMSDSSDYRQEGNYGATWVKLSKLPEPPETACDELYAIGKLLKALPADCDLQLANSYTIRVAHLFPLPPTVRVNCNRGVNGIDGSMSTAVGFSAENTRPTFYITGDLSYFYDMNSLWIRHMSRQFRVLLINNSGGAVMYAPLSKEIRKTLPDYIAAAHSTSARGWVESLGIQYMAAHTQEEVTTGIERLLDSTIDGPILLEVFTEIESDVDSIKAYYRRVAHLAPPEKFYFFKFTVNRVKQGVKFRVKKVLNNLAKRYLND